MGVLVSFSSVLVFNIIGGDAVVERFLDFFVFFFAFIFLPVVFLLRALGFTASFVQRNKQFHTLWMESTLLL